LAAIGIPPVVPVESNGVFVRFSAATDRALTEAGYGYYGFGDPREGTSRLLCSFDTQPEDVDRFLQTARSAPA
jgi:threonine aldolase